MSFDYERVKKRLEELFSQNNMYIEIQCCYTVLYTIIYEQIKYMLIEKIKSFMCMNDVTSDGKLNRCKDYEDAVRLNGDAFKFGYLFYELNDEQIKTIEAAQKRRCQGSHQFLELFINQEHFSSSELKIFYNVLKYIDTYWINNVELDSPLDVHAHSVHFELISQIANRIFLFEEE